MRQFSKSITLSTKWMTRNSRTTLNNELYALFNLLNLYKSSISCCTTMKGLSFSLLVEDHFHCPTVVTQYALASSQEFHATFLRTK